MANSLNLAFDIDQPAAPIERSIDSGSTWTALPVPTTGTHKTALLTGIPAAAYGVGVIKLRPVGYPAQVVSNTVSVTVTAGASTLAGLDLHLIGDSLIVGTRGGATGNDLLGPIILSRLAGQNVRVTTHGYSGQNADYIRTQVATIAATRDTTGSKTAVAFVNLAANDVINFDGGQGARDHAALLTADLYAAGFTYVYMVEPMNRNDSYAQNFFINTTRHFNDERLILRGLERTNSPKYHDGTIALDPTVLAAEASTENAFYFAVNDLDSLSRVHLTAGGNYWYAEAMAQKAGALLGATLPATTLPVPPPATSAATLVALNSGATITGSTVTGTAGVADFAGVSVSTQKLTGLGTMRWVPENAATATFVGIATARTATGSYPEIIGLYYNPSGAANLWVMGTNIATGQTPVVGFNVDFALTAHPTNSALYRCQVSVNAVALGAAIDIPAGQYFLTTASSAGCAAHAFYVAGGLGPSGF